MSLFEEYDGEIILGKDAMLPRTAHVVFISDDDKFLLYTGYFPKELNRRYNDLLFIPAPMTGECHSYDKPVKFVYKYIRAEYGCLVLDDYIDIANKKTQRFKKIQNLSVLFGSNCSDYSAYITRKDGNVTYCLEDKKITRSIFGLTEGDVYELSKTCGKMKLLFRNQKFFYWPPRITRSKYRCKCSWTEALILSGFPFITFAPPGMNGNIVSIYGLCKELQKMCENRMDSELGKALLENGLPEDTLEHIINMPDVPNILKDKDFYMEV